MNNAIEEVKRTGLELFVFLIVCITIICAVLFSSLSYYETRAQAAEITVDKSATSYDPLAAEREAVKRRNPLAK